MPDDGSRVHTPRVAVFAPSPLLEVAVQLDGPSEEVHLHPAGQGYWIARMIGTLGPEVVVCAALGEETGFVLGALLEDSPAALRYVQSAGWNGCLIHEHRESERRELAVTAPAPLNRHELDDLYGMMLIEGMEADVAVLGGPDQFPDTLQPDVSRRLAHDLTSGGARVVADLSGEPLRAALSGGLHLLKVSADELEEMELVSGQSVEQLSRAAEELAGQGADHVVVSRASEGVLAYLDGRVLTMTAPTLDVVDPKGAGDSMTGAFAAGLARGNDLETTIRLGAAAGALNTTRHGLASGTRREIEALVDYVQVEEQ